MVLTSTGSPAIPGQRACATAGDAAGELRALLAGGADVGSLLVRYQPVVAVSDGSPLGVEALVRWRHPRRGLVPPDDFVAVAEAAGLGAALDEHVLAEALRQVAAWDRRGVLVHRVGVNLGRSSIQGSALVETVQRACDAAGLAPDRLALEVLEHDELTLDVETLGRLQTLADAGATIAIDDFGSGCAGLRYLQLLPVGLVKLDRSLLPDPLVTGARGAPAAGALLAGLAALASATGAEITAEGVETPAHEALLRQAGIHHAQGWLYAPALDPEDVTDFWRARGRALP